MRVGVFVFGSLVTACASHVDLVAPAASAPVNERIAAYEQLKGLSYDTRTVTTTTTMNGSAAGATSTAYFTDDMHLANGTRVFYAQDILKVVPEESITARYASAARSKRSTAIWLTLAAVASVVGGAFLAIVPVATAQYGQVNPIPIVFGANLALGAIGLGIAAKVVGESGEHDKAQAFETYNTSLLQRLRLCPQNSQLADCP
jgi:hypothetical protein